LGPSTGSVCTPVYVWGWVQEVAPGPGRPAVGVRGITPGFFFLNF